MNQLHLRAFAICLAWIAIAFAHRCELGAKDAVPTRQIPWLDSKVKGSPDPPLPYKATRVFPGVSLDRPTDAVWVPTAKKWIATQNAGKLVMFDNDPANAVVKPFLDMSDAHGDRVFNAYAVLFHPDQEKHPWCFVTYVTNPKDLNGVKLGRLKVTDPTVPSVDPGSLQELLSWSSKGHAGGTMQFGPDGMLYFSVGDGQGPYPPDADNTGQDLSDLQASIVRINVTNPTAAQPYRTPSDNPFVGQPNAREEIWSFGLRNAWKIAFDPASGDLLAADVGWEMREMIHRVVRGRNHGWSIMEGSQTVKQGIQPKVPITLPLYEHTHVESRSISGGHFWQSDRIPELKGAYIYGDWMTGKVWALKHQGDEVLWQKELVDTPHQIIGFMLGPDGDVLILAYDGTILRLDPNTIETNQEPFPRRLADTGIFSNVAKQIPALGVAEYQISAHHWADGAHSRQWIAVPESQQLGLYNKDNWMTGDTAGRFNFPPDTVLAKTVSYYTDASNPESQRHIETQLLHRYDDDWRAYNYIWNDEQTDAVLQDDVATERKLVIKDPGVAGGSRSQTWRHASRSECLLCHIWAAGTAHAFWPEQLNIALETENQLDHLTRLGLFQKHVTANPPPPSPYDTTHPLQDRARSYLALNCSTCHRKQGGGTADFNFDLTKTLEENNYIDAAPAQGSLGLDNACVVASGDPLRSVLLYRALKSGRGHMPQFGSNVIDIQGVQLLYDWIESLPPKSEENQRIKNAIAALADGPTSVADIQSLLSTLPGAMSLSMACNDESMDANLKNRVVKLATTHDTPLVRDLFEHYLPEDQRIKRLGPTIDADALLSIKGSAESGRHLFEQASDINCRACHRIGQVGQNVGPDLSGIGSQQRPDEILASLLNPSTKVAPNFRSRQILTVDGKALTGIVVNETDVELTLVDSTGKQFKVPADDIEAMQPVAKSAMPDQLLSGMTAQQAADLLSFLSAQKKIGPLQHKQALILRATGPIVIDGKRDESPWASAASIGDFVFTWSDEDDGNRQPTDARMLWDDDYLYVSFQCSDQDVQAKRNTRDSKVYRDDCVEVFASPEINHAENYFNLEMNALGAQLDAYRSASVPGKPSDWNPEGIQIAVAVDGSINDSSDVDQGWSLEVAIPFSLFKHVLPSGKPKPGDRWRLNLNRLEDDQKVLSQWSQGDRNFPRFHHPEYFGFVEFADSRE
ncbi:carbohydrate-binding family 9-like protein [Planctomycetes bacterium K23_9]|uniref:Soluble aldose sugar dehydrogenase YliI n=1 Tax=Stieleria marina TaxID=1930275 RepID=A0A517NS38_9BACT|nr:Soluble aldose sugar dehydrogenase YliI precursor [Planctomycetes bacterium K23_9]